MVENITTSEYRQTVMKNFLEIPDEFKNDYKSKGFYWIYIIENTKNHKIYVGQTNNLYLRCLRYLGFYFRKTSDQYMTTVLIEEGIGNFKMYPIRKTDNRSYINELEKYYIKKYNSIENGYNISPGGSLNRDRKYTNMTKMAKSKVAVAINPEKKEIIFTTGLKLFGDYLGKGKDMVKNTARRCSQIVGYYIIYLNEDDLNAQVSKCWDKISTDHATNKKFMYNNFLVNAKYVQTYIGSGFKTNPDNYTVKFMVQSEDEKNPVEFIEKDKFVNFFNIDAHKGIMNIKII